MAGLTRALFVAITPDVERTGGTGLLGRGLADEDGRVGGTGLIDLADRTDEPDTTRAGGTGLRGESDTARRGACGFMSMG